MNENPATGSQQSDSPEVYSPESDAPTRGGLRGLIAEKPWILLVGYIVIFVGLSFASLGIALAHPPQIISGG